MVCIIDDREDVWSYATNLIHVKPYHFFQHTGDINAPPGLEKHESDDKEGIDLTQITKNKCKSQKKVEPEADSRVGNVAVNGKVEVSGEDEDIKEERTNGTSDGGRKKDEEKETNDVEEAIAPAANPDVNGTKSENEELNTSKGPDPPPNQSEITPPKQEESVPSKEEELIEIEDSDDYLLHLEDILMRIHKAFYEEYDKMESGEVPDLKKVIPEVRNKVLKGTKLVFSGLVPTHIKLEQSKAYQVARSLGAQVTADLEDDTTHLVAIRPGTAKVNAGRRRKNIKIVTPDWLWACAEWWEHVEERLFVLNNKGSKNRHPPPHCSSPEHAPSYPVGLVYCIFVTA